MKSLAPETLRAAQVRWQLFVTLTWRGQPPRADKRQVALKWWLRKCARKVRVPYPRLVWIARDGDPVAREVRPHWHVLICGLPTFTLGLELGCAMARFWYNHGGVDAREWVEGLGAFDYSTNIGANGFEANQFGKTVTIVCSENLLRPDVTGTVTGDSRQEDVDARHSENPVVGCSNTESPVGLVQSRAERSSSEVMQTVPGMSSSHGCTKLVTRSPGCLVAVKAGRTGVECYYQADITGAL